MNTFMEEETMKWYPAGWDFGNAEVDFVANIKGEVKKISTPTAFASVDVSAMQNLGVERGDDDKMIIELEDDGTAYAFGEYALSQNKDTYNGRGDEERYASKFALRALIVSAAHEIPDKEFGLYVVSGLPAGLYIKKPKLRELIKERYTGTYRFTLDGKTKRTIHLAPGPVVMEGAGALIGEPGLNSVKVRAPSLTLAEERPISMHSREPPRSRHSVKGRTKLSKRRRKWSSERLPVKMVEISPTKKHAT